MCVCEVHIGNVRCHCSKAEGSAGPEKFELLGWNTDQEHFEALEIILEICNMVKCKGGNCGQFVCLLATVLVMLIFLFKM